MKENEFPKYPLDFCALTREFEDEEIERLLSQDIKDVAQTIDMLKTREVNATKAYQNLKDKIREMIEHLKEDKHSYLFRYTSIKELENLLP